MDIRKIKKCDKNTFLELSDMFYSSEVVLHKVNKINFENTFDELINREIYTECFIIEEGERVIGYCLVSKTYSQEVGGMVLLVEELFILEEYRNLGIGKKVFNYLFERYRDFKRIRLEVEFNNERAKKLYNKLGFENLDYLQMVIDKEENNDR
ncbi:GNAT family N-acetyltransferase [Streptobacillus felis]|uniref:GNAT family N-acetyltransferase n=1 Tax=Streptobacillus felis TaxID=1384509 RepID=A0A7Z0PFA0_9FUSO|nr:GNAT family N-acetyltransferase [Streptobacillus felis]NYV28137.1 GNAT family N-acetyltransferase [Streptobacillus felis]